MLAYVRVAGHINLVQQCWVLLHELALQVLGVIFVGLVILQVGNLGVFFQSSFRVGASAVV